MARSIQDIKNEVTQEFMRNENAAARYGFEPGTPFSDRFSAASIENIFMYVWAVCAWIVEQLMDRHREEVNSTIEAIIPHRPKWYRDKVLAFMADMELESDSDTYDLSDMSENEIAARRIVKHAVATESRDAGLLTIKVAAEGADGRCPLNTVQETQLKAYIGEIKDAGVRVSLVNLNADTFNCKVDVYYNAMLQPDAVRNLCEETIRQYIQNLPFNGEYTNMALVDRLQQVEGVKIVEMRESSAKAADEDTVTLINARLTPSAGYFMPGEILIDMIAYEEQY